MEQRISKYINTLPIIARASDYRRNVSGYPPTATVIATLSVMLKSVTELDLQATPMRKKTSQIYVVHIITSLATDGAATMLYRILAHTNRSHYYPVVISLDEDTGHADKIRAHGIPVHCLNMANSLTSGWHILRLVRLLRELDPDMIQGWLYHGNLAASIANHGAV
ncbi:glycosyltransferase family protein [Candidatus Thiothrix anitrata]|uniref:Uncharacterized protein n=1 Tax=Candidatus Thiothrix anitrata TaxID=2823902 RepID=A0ABX7WZG2_9GAMM|nr:hypothetical protein [Candidatus Thiothrix anitrata]QTR48736.1 hypothetical protein J8380_10565 [Candidatus Thiothrix anitrata]